jgi:hypothetical protein
MPKFKSPLDHVRVAAPCPADWDRMVGDDRSRFCDQCSLRVYNLSGMTRREAETLISNTEGRVCVRYYRRRDGTVATRNCPVGLRAVKQRVSRVAGSVLSAVLGFYSGVWVHVGLGPRPHITGTLPAPADTTAPVDQEAYKFTMGAAVVDWEKPERVVGPLSRLRLPRLR